MLTASQKRKAIQSYRDKLSMGLERRFGWARCYSIEQVKQCAQSMGVDMEFIAYAFAMFCSREDFEEYFARTWETCEGRHPAYDLLCKQVPRCDPPKLSPPQESDATVPVWFNFSEVFSATGLPSPQGQ